MRRAHRRCLCCLQRSARRVQAWARERRRFGEIINMMESLAEMLVVLHGAGFVHRDVKPGNALVLLDSHLWKLLDFGIMAKAGAWPSL